MNESIISVRYSRALFQSALEKKITDKVNEDMILILEVCKTAEMKEFLESPEMARFVKEYVADYGIVPGPQAIQAYAGMMAMTGEPGSSPVKCGAPVVDYATGTTAAAAILAALLHRKDHGRGQFVEVAMSDVALILCSSHLTGHLWNGWHPEQKGNRYPFATIGCYQAADAPLMISASNLRQQRRLWEVLGRGDLIKKTNRERISGHGEESEALRVILATMPVEHWERVLQAARVPASRVQRMEAMLADEHVKGRKVLHRFDESAGSMKGLTVPVAGFRLSECDVGVSTAPQAAGAQNKQVLKSLGYMAKDIENMRSNGVI